MPVLRGTPLIFAPATGEAMILSEPLSLWGGMDPETGEIIDRRHPQAGRIVTARILLMPSGRGSSSSSTILAEAIRRSTAPAAIVLLEPDPILALGSLVAEELYGTAIPVLVLSERDYSTVPEGAVVEVDRSGTLTL